MIGSQTIPAPVSATGTTATTWENGDLRLIKASACSAFKRNRRHPPDVFRNAKASRELKRNGTNHVCQDILTDCSGVPVVPANTCHVFPKGPRHDL
jgi:hypothetical protein